MKTRVLCFLDNPLGRDTEIILPVIYGLEKYLNCELRVKFIWDLLHIKLWEPDIVLLPNTRGHPMYVEIASFSKKHGIRVLALDSEGNFRVDGSFDYWGYNKNQEVYQEFITCWSERTLKFTQSLLANNYNQRIILTGGVGFDRYSFPLDDDKNEFLTSVGKEKFKKVIGYAGWAFGKLYSKQRSNSFKGLLNANPPKSLDWVEKQRQHVRESLRFLIENNKDILFILKKHPKENFEDDPIEGFNEMNELLDYPNVIYLKKEHSIEQIIHVSDIWMGFETTTLFEAWALNKPTILINETIDFPRSKHFRGALIVKSGEEAQKYIAEFYYKGTITEFHRKELKERRRKSINDSIGFLDGLNHLRTLQYFRNSIPAEHCERRIPLNHRHLRLFVLMHVGRFFFWKWLFLRLPKFRKTVYVFENRTMNGFENRKRTVYNMMDKFYRENKLDTLLRGNKWESLRKIIHNKQNESGSF